tara:strand:+ start:204 stop:539 length:336 start_codon:yes stop_codon:yes gene_type:complete
METNKAEKTFTQSTLVYFDRTENGASLEPVLFDLEGYGYRLNGEFLEIYPHDLVRLKKEVGDHAFDEAMVISKDFGFDTIVFCEADFEENANPWTLSYEEWIEKIDMETDK